jgi:hypothetical protein
MELTPLNPAESDDNDKKESSSKKKKSAEAIGAIIVEPKKERATDTSESLLDRLLGKEPKPESNKPGAAESEPQNPEVDAPLESISRTEKHFVESELVGAERADGDADDEPDLTDAERIAADDAVERFRDKIVEDDQDSDQAFEEIIDELHQEAQESDNEQQAEPDAQAAPEAETNTDESEPEASESEDPQDFEEVIDLRGAASQQAPPSGNVPPNTGNTPPPGNTTGPNSGNVPPSSANTPPPQGPGNTPPNTGNTPPPNGRTTGFAPPAGGYGPNSAPAAAAPNVMPRRAERNNEAGMFIFGGIVGYLIGRRRGRIKTERRLLPIQDKLEKQVKKLQQELVLKESAIRQTAIEQVRKQPERAVAPKRRLERPVAEQQRRHPEREYAAPVLVPLERIGRVVMHAEAESTPAVAEVEAVMAKKRSEIVGLQERDVLTMSRAELLAATAKIIIEGSSLRHIYETNLVTEKGVRRLLVEYLRGGNVQKALRRELVEREIDFERDPILRDKGSQTITGGGADQLVELLQKAGVQIEDDAQQTATVKAQLAKKKAQQEKKQQNRRMADVALATTIAVLIGVIATLLLTR